MQECMLLRHQCLNKPVIKMKDHSGVGDRWAMAQLSASGEDVVGRVRCPQYLLLARTLLLGRPGTGLPWKWWALRTLAVQQRILSGPAATLQTEIEQLTEEVWSLQHHDQNTPCFTHILTVCTHHNEV